MISKPEAYIYVKRVYEHKEIRAFFRKMGLDALTASEIASILGWDRDAVQNILHTPPMPDLPGEPLFELTEAHIHGASLPEVRQRIRCAVIQFLLPHPMFRVGPSGGEEPGASHRAVGLFMGGSGRDVADCLDQ